MKELRYIIVAGLALAGCCLASCDEDVLTEQESQGTFPENVADGYMSVSFIPENGLSTRTEVQGWSKTIFRVEALLYHGDDVVRYSDASEGNVLLETAFEGTESEGLKWPYECSYKKDLKRGETYTIVYLGNIPRDNLSGTDKLSTARIHAPEGNWPDWFNGNNMYYFFSQTFTVPTIDEDAGTSMNIYVILRRLVSRHIIGGYGIPEGCDPGGDEDYEERYYESFLDEEHPLGLGEKMFSGLESVMGKQFVNKLTYDFIFPSAYMLDEKYMEGYNTLKTWWTENKDSYWNNYTTEGLDKATLESGWNVGNGNGWYNNTSGSTTYDDKPKALAALLNALLENNEGCMEKLYEDFKSKNIKKLENSAMEGPGSYTTARQTIAQSLKKALTGTSLAAWSSGGQAVITLNAISKTLDFSLNQVEAVETSESMTIEMEEDETGENTLTFLLLGTKSSGCSFGYSSFTTESLNLPTGDFPGAPLLPNVSTSYRIRTEGELSLGTMTSEQADVYFSYKAIIEKLVELGLDSSLGYDAWAGENAPFYYYRFTI